MSGVEGGLLTVAAVTTTAVVAAAGVVGALPEERREALSATGGHRESRRPAELERALRSRELERALPAAERQRLVQQLLTLRWTLVRAVCSDPWYDHCWATGEAFPPRAQTTPMRPCRCARCRATGRVWPAHYDATDLARRTGQGGNAEDREPKVRVGAGRLEELGVAGCESVNDAPTQEDGAGEILSYECYLESLDDWAAAQLPSSPSGIALRAIREGRIRLRGRRTKTRRR
jgi:hypothetical protein